MEARKVILIADDEQPLLGLLQTFLQDQGFEVLTACDGEEALRLSRHYNGSIDLLLADIAMPHVDGISAYQQISAERRNMKVLFMSGSIPRSLTIPEGLPFLAKPFETLGALTSKLREILESENPGQAA